MTTLILVSFHIYAHAYFVDLYSINCTNQFMSLLNVLDCSQIQTTIVSYYMTDLVKLWSTLLHIFVLCFAFLQEILLLKMFVM